MVNILFIVSIASILVLIGTAAAIVHHIRAGKRARLPQAPPEPSFTEHLYSAIQYGTPRSARLIPPQNVKSISAKKDWTPSSQAASLRTSSYKHL
jgi:hypothetical protein